MGLFINSLEHPHVYKNKGKLTEPNQGYFKIDFFAELLKRQENVNHSLFYSYHDLKMKNQLQTNVQHEQWKQINNQLQKLNESNLQHQQFAGDAITWQKQFDQKMMHLNETLKREETLKQEIIDQLEHQASFNKQFELQLADVNDLQKQMVSWDSEQEGIQKDVLERLEEQEAVMEKMSRNLDHFRSILFERTSHLVEKMEDSYDLTATYFYNLLTGSDQPLTLMMMREGKKVKQSKQD